MRKFGSFLLGSLLGGVVGAVLAILFAPSSGNELRGNVRSYALKTVDDVKQAALQRREEMEQQLAKMRTGSSIKIE